MSSLTEKTKLILHRKALGVATYARPRRCPKCGTLNYARVPKVAVCLGCVLKEKRYA